MRLVSGPRGLTRCWTASRSSCSAPTTVSGCGQPGRSAGGGRRCDPLGVGAGSSRLVAGTMTIHRRLEERLAAFHRRDSALVFGSAYLADAGCIAALARQGEVVVLGRAQPAFDRRRLPALGRRSLPLSPRRRRAPALGHRTGRGSWRADRQRERVRRRRDLAPLQAIIELAQRFGLRTATRRESCDRSARAGRPRRAGRGTARGPGRPDRRHAR